MMKRTILCLALTLLLSTAAQADKRAKVALNTTMGRIVIELYDETPQHKANFLKLCRAHFYDKVLFHRVIEDFMIQGGDPDSKNAPLDKQLGDGGPGYDVPAEIDYPRLFHKRGVLAAAREGDDVNPEKMSSGSQFYIVWGKRFSKAELSAFSQRQVAKGIGAMPAKVAETYRKVGGTPHLDGGYTVFGEVVEGLKVVDKIQRVKTMEGDRPFDDVVILSTEILSE